MIKIKVPATTANLGPGYDCSGMALNLYNIFTFKKGKSNVNENNLIYRSFKYFYDYYKIKVPEIEINVDSEIPSARGLGSSATCIVAGIMAANILSGKNIEKNKILKLATEIEGHPDNVAPAIFGGIVTSIVEDEVFYSREEVDDNLNYLLLIPDFELSTEEARKVVPKEITLNDAVSNIGRAVLVTKAITIGNFNLLKGSALDKLHEPYRKKLIEDFDIFEKIAQKDNGVIFISEAGPTILIIAEKENKKIIENIENQKESKNTWILKNLKADNNGAVVLD